MQSDIVILDDSLSALDQNTRDLIIGNLLGPSGLFRRRNTTVLWITSDGKLLLHTDGTSIAWANGMSARFMRFADQVLTVHDSQVTEIPNSGRHDVNHAENNAVDAPWNASAKEIDENSLFPPESELQEQKIEESNIDVLTDPGKHTERNSVYRT